MRFRLIALSLLAASLTRAQKLAPEIARLARVRAQTLEALQHTRNYTCVETVHRFQSPRAEAWFKPVDVLRLEVGNIDGTERVSFLGDQTFDERPRAEVIASGLIVSGVFDSFARGAFVGRSASTRYIGEDAARDRPAFKYEYRVPLNNANFTLTTARGSARIGYHGEFWIDREREEVLRMTVIGEDVPVELGIMRFRIGINYSRYEMNGKRVLLPESAEVESGDWTGTRSRSASEFTQCRAFLAESAIRFTEETDTPQPAGAIPTPVAPEELAGGLQIPIRVETGFGYRQSSVGDRLEGRVEQDVLHKGKVVVPKGTLVIGRLRRLEKRDEASVFVYAAVEFTEMLMQDRRIRFTGLMEKIRLDPAIGTQAAPKSESRETGAMQESPPKDLPGVGGFFLTASPYEVAPGLQIVWRTKKF